MKPTITCLFNQTTRVTLLTNSVSKPVSHIRICTCLLHRQKSAPKWVPLYHSLKETVSKNQNDGTMVCCEWKAWKCWLGHDEITERERWHAQEKSTLSAPTQLSSNTSFAGLVRCISPLTGQDACPHCILDR